MVTPVNADKFEKLLLDTGYDREETSFIAQGFRNGFDLGYRGQTEGIQRLAPNLKLEVGNEVILWNKVMKEVKLGRFAGPYSQPPFKNFIQSPIGLVPKDQGKDVRLIFHLSYPKNGVSVNWETPKEFCSVQYKEFSDAIKLCLQAGVSCFVGKSDLSSAFRNLGISKKFWKFLLLKARNPLDGNIYFFCDKSLPFGSSASCQLFQRVSNGLAHVVMVRNNGKIPVNYLDDFLFVALIKYCCDQQIQVFLDTCDEIGLPVSLEKTEWGCTLQQFLGMLIDTINQVVGVPVDKIKRAKDLIAQILNGKKTTVYLMQKICGFLNFLCRCIVPGRAFTRGLHCYFNSKMKPHYHLNVTKDMRADLKMWLSFLEEPSAYCRPFIDFNEVLQADVLNWYMDASGNIGIGGIFNEFWFQQKWDLDFIHKKKPSITYLELHAVCVSIFLWLPLVQNKRICLFCDNSGAKDIINTAASRCKNCRVLIRLLTLECMKWNVRVFARYVRSRENFLADNLSRFKMKEFWRDIKRLDRNVQQEASPIPEQLWPLDKLWID